MFPRYPEGHARLWSLTKRIMDFRESQEMQGKDFISRLVELKREVAADPNSESHRQVVKTTEVLCAFHAASIADRALNCDIITAQGVIFFAAGFETTSSTLGTLTHTLATRPDVQERVYNEVMKAKEENGGKLNQDTMERLEYLEATVMENMRVHPPVLISMNRVALEWSNFSDI